MPLINASMLIDLLRPSPNSSKLNGRPTMTLHCQVHSTGRGCGCGLAPNTPPPCVPPVDQVGHPPLWFLNHPAHKHCMYYAQAHMVTSPQPLLLLLTILPIGLFPLGVGAACTDLDNATGDTILPIMVTGGVLNLVSINITHSPAHLDMVNWLMSKHGWHIVLVQETGLLCDAEVGMEDHIHCQLTNNIHFNSPSTPTLHAKQTAVQLSKLDHQLHEGHISQAQFDSKKMAINSS